MIKSLPTWAKVIGFPIVLALGLALLVAILYGAIYAGQTALVFAWRLMPPVLLGSACLYGFFFAKIPKRCQIGLGVAFAAFIGYLFWTCGVIVTPLVVVSLIGGLLMWNKRTWAATDNNGAGMRLLKCTVNYLPRALVMVAFLWLVAANTMTGIMEYELARHINQTKTVLNEHPVTVPDRVLSRATGYKYLTRANQVRTQRIEQSHLVWMPAGRQTALESADKTIARSEKVHCIWQAPLKYNNNVTRNKYWYSFWGSVAGVVRVDCSDMAMNADRQSGSDAFFMFGDDSWVTESIFRVAHPLSKISQRVYWQKEDGSWSFLISYTTYKPTWTGTMIPVMGGTMEFGSYGTFTNYSMDEARENFHGATLASPELALEYGNAYRKYRGGLKDVLWDQEDLLEISQNKHDKDVFPNQNSHPYFQNMDGIGPQLSLPFEPEGDASDALTTVLFFDASSFKISEYNHSGEPSVNGPRTMLVNVNDAAPDWDWQDYNIVEPLVIVTEDGQWYVQVGVISKDSSDAVGVVVVNSVKTTSVAFRGGEIEAYRIYLKSGVVPKNLEKNSTEEK